jgi:hypothetical protein
MNLREFFLSTIGGQASASNTGLPEDIKCIFLCAPDVRKELDWDEIDGVRRVKEIRFYSDITNTKYSVNLYIKRIFSYKPATPRDLFEIDDFLLSL